MALSERISIVLRAGLGYEPQLLTKVVAAFDFDSVNGIGGFPCGAVPPSKRAVVREQLGGALDWCVKRFPIGIASGPTDVGTEPAIRRIVVGQCTRRNDMLGVSSPDAPGVVVAAADWPLTTFYRFASVIAHEAVHQALFRREVASQLVRPRSLAYSPWRRTLRPGRNVWHSFWTFASQFSMLAEAALSEVGIVREDAKILEYLAEMYVKLRVCKDSIMLFDVLGHSQCHSWTRALDVVEELAELLRKLPGYTVAEARWNSEDQTAYRSWARATSSSVIS